MGYVINRISNTQDDGCFGVFSIEGKPFCVTMEETWLDNQKLISCIPAGTYEVEKYSGTKYQNVWIVKDVPNRSAILIHWGNTEQNTAGCILMGMEYGKFGDKTGIIRSKEAIDKLRKILPNKFTLEIKDCFQ
jgi:hypothetical protein